MPKIVNHSTTLPLSHVQTKLNTHIEKMNAEGWELMSVAVEAIGIEEVFIMFWRKELEQPQTLIPGIGVVTFPGGGGSGGRG